uniref:Uncharacterized protein n=1 Tax=Arundo donax TaxID=35708 RepID=A0A0A9B983_ARUDO
MPIFYRVLLREHLPVKFSSDLLSARAITRLVGSLVI